MKMEIRGVEKLSIRERQVVALKETGASHAQIAARLGVNKGTVATLLNRARSKGYQVVLIVEGDPLDIFSTNDDIEENEEEE